MLYVIEKYVFGELSLLSFVLCDQFIFDMQNKFVDNSKVMFQMCVVFFLDKLILLINMYWLLIILENKIERNYF